MSKEPWCQVPAKQKKGAGSMGLPSWPSSGESRHARRVVCRSILTERPGLIEIPLVQVSVFEADLTSSLVLLHRSCEALDKSLKLSEAKHSLQHGSVTSPFPYGVLWEGGAQRNPSAWHFLSGHPSVSLWLLPLPSQGSSCFWDPLLVGY